MLIAFFDTLEILVIGTLWFKVPIRGSLGLLLVLSALFLVGSLGIGLFISTIARTQQEAMMLAWFTMLPTHLSLWLLLPAGGHAFMVAGRLLWRPAALLPGDHPLGRAQGRGAGSLTGEIAGLAVFGTVMMGAAALRFRKRLD